MNISDVMDELGTALGTITGLRVSVFDVGTITPPTAIVGLPDDATFDLTYQRGMDRLTIPITVLLSKTTERVATKQLANYLSGSGDLSIKAAIDGGTYTACNGVRVASATVSVVTIGAIDYLAATFSLDVIGQGE